MFVGHFTEWPWQDPVQGYKGFGLGLTNEKYNPQTGSHLYNRFLDEKLYAEEAGFDGLMLNEHHNTAFCMQGVTNVAATILTRQTRKAKIVILGNILPIWEDPLWLAEQLAMLDMISHGRMVTGWVRGGGTESLSHNAQPTYNRERFQEAHDFIVKTWTTPGPFRWEGKHFQFRYVNPWCMPLQKPHPQMWIPGVASPETVKWCAEHRYPHVMLATLLEPTKEMFQLYDTHAAELGYKAGPQHHAYLFKVHPDETEELAEQAGRRYLEGVDNPFIAGSQGQERALAAFQQLPGISTRATLDALRKTVGRVAETGIAASTIATVFSPYEEQIKNYSIIAGTPKTVMPRIKHVLETLRPGSVFFWDGDGNMSHEDQTRSIRLHGQEVIPATKELGKAMGLLSSFESNDGTGISPEVWAKVKKDQTAKA
ncbi:MAG: LLM class flavin-dependent oxidoreductase [Dehalococcoidia bacterium]|nr:LLM class flavin-dependent oxidoreductase [Dehalococcoidia bacterium]